MSGPGLTIVVPIGSPAVSGVDVTTCDGLQSATAAWLNRGDLEARHEDFVVLLEARLNRILRTPEMEASTTLTADSGAIALPTDFLEARQLHLSTDPLQPLEQMTPQQLRHFWAASSTGKPQNYAIRNGTLLLGPAPDTTYSLELHYWQAIPNLCSQEGEPNWLSSAHPDIYLYGILMQAEFYGWNDERLPLIKSAWDEAISELTEHGTRKRYGGGPLRMRASVVE